MKDRILFYEGLKEKVELTEESHRVYLQEGFTIENNFTFGLYEFRGLIELLYEKGDVSKLADYFELFGTANRSLMRDHSNRFWFVYPPLVWLLCSTFYHYRTGRAAYAANLAKFNYSYMEELKIGLTHGFDNILIGDTELGMFDELMGYFSLLFDPSRFEAHMCEAKRLIEQHVNHCNEINVKVADEDDEDTDDMRGLDENTIVSEYTYQEAQRTFDIVLILCFEIDERTITFAEREQIFVRLKKFFAFQPDWDTMKKPSLRMNHFEIMSPYQ
ncbi:hypothetical protein [Paenibacillus luteus]|uniref:hypothetical protein n=1 Tax=Paenibacillus luteus TaxID=2545753 RepID=UPI0011444CFA|nr:hypothetical protein [Paenibacillus luteus]